MSGTGKPMTKVGTLKKYVPGTWYVFFPSYLQLFVRNLSQNVLDLKYLKIHTYFTVNNDVIQMEDDPGCIFPTHSQLFPAKGSHPLI
jgi:hypothetical protein